MQIRYFVLNPLPDKNEACASGLESEPLFHAEIIQSKDPETLSPLLKKLKLVFMKNDTEPTFGSEDLLIFRKESGRCDVPIAAIMNTNKRCNNIFIMIA